MVVIGVGIVWWNDMRMCIGGCRFTFMGPGCTRCGHCLGLNEVKFFAVTAKRLVIKVAIKFIIYNQTEGGEVDKEFGIVGNKTTVVHTAMASKAVEWGA